MRHLNKAQELCTEEDGFGFGDDGEGKGQTGNLMEDQGET